MRFSIFPQDPEFFTLFEQMADLIAQACHAFQILVTDFTDVEAKVNGITDIEHQGDELFHELCKRLSASFVTPIDREDIHLIGSTMDDVLDLLQASANRMHLFRVEKMNPCLPQMAEVLVDCAAILDQGIKRVRKFEDVSDLRFPLKELESSGDKINRGAIAALFQECQTVPDVVNLIKWKEIIENVEDAIDRFEDVFDVIESVVVKNA